MKLSTKGRYAVMAMADLAIYSNGKPVALANVAARQEISLSYLEQLFAKLRRSNLVFSVRGPGGGYKLARAASDTRVSDIIMAVDEPLNVTRCEDGSPKGCTKTSSRCLTHDLWDELGRQIYLYLSSVSLDDVTNSRILPKGPRVPQFDPAFTTPPTDTLQQDMSDNQ
jgi:Rrf2 family iron-sulfur cluster assembly transcriptional regulator